MAKKWTYHTSHSFYDVETKQKVSAQTQLYQTGVYIIVNNNPAMQSGTTPIRMVRLEKELNKRFESGKITDLEYGREIIVVEEDGFYIEKQIT